MERTVYVTPVNDKLPVTTGESVDQLQISMIF